MCRFIHIFLLFPFNFARYYAGDVTVVAAAVVWWQRIFIDGMPNFFIAFRTLQSIIPPNRFRFRRKQASFFPSVPLSLSFLLLSCVCVPVSLSTQPEGKIIVWDSCLNSNRLAMHGIGICLKCFDELDRDS